MTHWTAEQAQRDFDILLDTAESDGPQRIVRGDVAFWLMTEEEYLRLMGKLEKELDG